MPKTLRRRRRPRAPPKADSFLYCLTNGDGSNTYVGVTNDMTRRLRQHNGTLAGGARYTRRGTAWRLLFRVTGLPDRRAAIQLEWRLHRKRRDTSDVDPGGINPFDASPSGRRAWKLCRALHMARVTSSATTTSTWRPVVHWHARSLHDWAMKRAWPTNIKHVLVDTLREH